MEVNNNNHQVRHPETEQSMDPENWEEFQELAMKMIADTVEDLRSIRQKPVWQPVPDDIKKFFSTAVPVEPSAADTTYHDFKKYIKPYPRGNNHPRFWGWVNGSGLPTGMLADFLASAMNPSVGSFENAASLVECQVLSWLKEMLEYPAEAGAVLTSGCSMSNLTGLTVARNAKAKFDVRNKGLAAGGGRMVLYTSTEAHSSIQKAVELLGFGNEALRRIPVDAAYRINLSILEKTISDDLAAGLHPFCVIGNAGTVNTGAVDDLVGLAKICKSWDCWLHVDGAFGALGWLCPSLHPLLKGLQMADSLAFDLHKWMYLPYSVGCVLVADKTAHQQAFTLTPPYLARTHQSPGADTNFPDYGIELTRRFRALKVWMCLKVHGKKSFEKQIWKNVQQAHYLKEKLRQHPEHFELVSASGLNIICFRFIDKNIPDQQLDAINQQMLVNLQHEGKVFLSHSCLDGRFVLRVAITNHRSINSDFDLLVSELLKAGKQSVS